MNDVQMKYFLKAAEELNFTNAAEQLYISQPALSKQLHAIEDELGITLFKKNGKKLSLTAAGQVFYDSAMEFNTRYEDMVHKVQMIDKGCSGIINIGLLEGQRLGDAFIDAYQMFIKKYPSIIFRLNRGTFSKLRHDLMTGKNDLIVTLGFDIEREEDMDYLSFEQNEAYFAVSKRHPLSKLDSLGWDDFKEETFIAISPEDSFVGSQMILNECEKYHFNPTIDYAPSLESAMLWIEAGFGVGIIDTSNYILLNPEIKTYPVPDSVGTEMVLGWSKHELSPIAENFIKEMKNSI